MSLACDCLDDLVVLFEGSNLPITSGPSHTSDFNMCTVVVLSEGSRLPVTLGPNHTNDFKLRTVQN